MAPTLTKPHSSVPIGRSLHLVYEFKLT
jgi:hypothetical protein